VIYKGQICHKGVPYPGEHEPLVSVELWERVDEQHKAGARKAKPHRKVHTLLAGFLYCGRCGSSLSVTYTVRRSVQHAYYICPGCKKRAEPSQRIRPVATTDLETSLVRELEPILGEQPGEIAIQQSLERVTCDPATRQVSVSLRDGSRFLYSLPAKPERRSKAGRVRAVSRLMALAICYQELARERKLRSYEELAKLGRLTRSRVSLILLLTNLAPAIQEELLFLPKVISGPERITEEQLRSIAKVIDWDEQIQLFRSLWDNSNPTSRRCLAISANASCNGVGYSFKASAGTHVPRSSEMTALSGPASAECAR
jgi:hypothetical protein